jgi:outer membrane immunogenic protein
MRGIMKKLLIAGAALAALIGTPALAADMALKAAPPPAAPAWSWTGFYAGVNLGGAWGTSKYTFLPGPAWTGGSGAQLAADGGPSLKMSSVSGGGQIGYNWQVNTIVFGAEADIEYTGLRKTNLFTQPGPACGCIVTPYTFTESSRSDWMATVRGRLGVTTGRVLFYGTGGVAFADSASADTLNFPTLAPAATFTGAGARSSIQTGWTAGGGVEWAFNDHWTAKAEYLYARFPTSTTGMNPINTTFTQSYTDRLTVNLARLGVNYKF